MTLLDSTSIIVGIIIGSTIFLSSPRIAGQVPNIGWLVGVWVIGAVFSLIGALCYAELATAYPKEGGDYVFLTEAFGGKIGFLFAWVQFWIVRPGSVGTLAFVFADYANQLCPLDESYRPLLIYAVGAVVVLSGINLLGVRAGKWTQNLLTAVKFLGLLAIVAVGMSCSAAATAPAAPPPAKQLDLGFAMIFVFLAFGGWNEMAYVSAEVRHPQKNILRALVLGTLAVAVVYIAVNLAFVHALGLAGLQQSKAVAADVLRLCIGRRAEQCISLLICITALGGINGMIFTGADFLCPGNRASPLCLAGSMEFEDRRTRPSAVDPGRRDRGPHDRLWLEPGGVGRVSEFGCVLFAVVLALSLPGRMFAVRIAEPPSRFQGKLPRAVLPGRAVVVLSFQRLHVLQESGLRDRTDSLGAVGIGRRAGNRRGAEFHRVAGQKNRSSPTAFAQNKSRRFVS